MRFNAMPVRHIQRISFFVVIFCSLQIVKAANEVPVCIADGFTCVQSCTQLVRCITSGNYTFTQQLIRTCPHEIGKLCSTSTLDCTASSCDDRDYYDQRLSCHESGVYPHPWDCISYLTCNATSGLAEKQTCERGTAYNPATQGCTSDMLQSEGCLRDHPIPKCVSQEDIGAYEEDKHIYYVCAYNENGYLLPELRRCNTGYYFEKEEGYCVIGDTASHLLSSKLLLCTVLFTSIFKSQSL